MSETRQKNIHSHLSVLVVATIMYCGNPLLLKSVLPRMADGICVLGNNLLFSKGRSFEAVLPQNILDLDIQYTVSILYNLFTKDLNILLAHMLPPFEVFLSYEESPSHLDGVYILRYNR